MVAGYRPTLIAAGLLCGIGMSRLDADIEAARVREAEPKAAPPKDIEVPPPPRQRPTPADVFAQLGASAKRRRKNERRAEIAKAKGHS